MKEFLEKLITRKREEFKKAQERSDASNDIAEVRALGVTLAALRDEIAECEKQLAELDKPAEPTEPDGGEGRKLIFDEEKAFLHSLPTIPFEIADWIYGRKVALDSHVIYQKNRYSCPYQYVGKAVDLKVTTSTLEIYYQHERIATHVRFPSYAVNRYSTHPEDMPDRFQKPEWDEKRIRRWADSIGKYTTDVIDRIFGSVQIKEQAYNPCLSVLNLSRSYTPERLEVACSIALDRIYSPRYRHLKAILSTNTDKTAAMPSKTTDEQGYVRGAEYYGGGSAAE